MHACMCEGCGGGRFVPGEVHRWVEPGSVRHVDCVDYLVPPAGQQLAQAHHHHLLGGLHADLYPHAAAHELRSGGQRGLRHAQQAGAGKVVDKVVVGPGLGGLGLWGFVLWV